MNIENLAQQLDEAALRAEAVDQISLQQSFGVDDAYAIQAASLQRRYARGEHFIGLKMGFTSRAKMQQMGVHDMIWGRLTDAMLLPAEGTLSLQKHIHPRAEPELCFLVNQPIDRELSAAEAPDFVSGIAPAIEVIDSRYRNFKFSLEDVIADNCSSAALAVGPWQPTNTPIGDLQMELLIDGAVVHEGNSSAILGDPWKSFMAATRLAAQYGQPIPEGALIMAGAATPAVYLQAGQSVEVRVAQLGEVAFAVH
ncbi:MAG: fumarylacetoacetate hydrolase family protein [Bacteroidota bacterium]